MYVKMKYCQLVKNRHGGNTDNLQVIVHKPVFHKILNFKGQFSDPILKLNQEQINN